MNVSANSIGSVYRLTDSDGAELTEVRFGSESVTEVQIISGLREGDQIILSDLTNLKNAKRISLN